MGRSARRMAEQSPWEAVLAQLEGHYSEAVMINERMKRIYPSPLAHLPALLHWGQ
jgi:hypothetical protein